MEGAPFMMRTQGLSSHLKLRSRNPRYDDSWEEQAFAEDALGPLGGCVWPPRSYSCSFCRREFRSAQALGGHMNVHRRDRARLKQSPVANNQVFVPENRQDQASNQFQNCVHVSLDLPYLPFQNCSTPGYNPNPNCDLPPPFVSPTSPNPRVSDSRSDHVSLDLNPFYFSSVKENHTKPTIPSSPPSWPNSVKDKIPLTLNMVIRAYPDASINKEEVQSCKRRRIDDSSLPPLFFNEIQPEKMIDEFTASIREEDLDLELRLGGRPKKKKVQI